MSLNFNTPAKMIAGLLISLSFMAAAQAAMPMPINLKDAVNMSFDQRLAHIKEVNAAILKSTPEQVALYWYAVGGQMATLSPEDQKYIAEKREANMKALTPEQKNALKEEQKAYFDALTPEQRAAIITYLAERKKNLEAANK